MFSLVQTAKGNGLKQEEYIRNLFEQAPYCKNKEGGKKILAWNIELKPFDDKGGQQVKVKLSKTNPNSTD